MPRIEGSNPVSQVDVPMSAKTAQGRFSYVSSISSLSFGGITSWVSKTVSTAWEKITGFFRWLFPSFFAKKEEIVPAATTGAVSQEKTTASGQPVEITFSKVNEDTTLATYRLLADGKGTENEIKIIPNKGQPLEIYAISFPDMGMRKEIKNMLRALLKFEEASHFQTKNLGTAMQLFDANLVCNSSIKYDTASTTLENKYIKKILDASLAKKGELSDRAKEALVHIEEILSPSVEKSLVQSVFNLNASVVVVPAGEYTLSVTDLMILIKEKLKITNPRAVLLSESLQFNLS